MLVLMCRSAMPAAPQTLPPDTFEITNKLLEKCYEYYKASILHVRLCMLHKSGHNN